MAEATCRWGHPRSRHWRRMPSGIEYCAACKQERQKRARLANPTAQEHMAWQVLATEWLTTVEVAARLHTSPQSVGNTLRSLAARGRVERRKDPAGGRNTPTQWRAVRVSPLQRFREDRDTLWVTAAELLISRHAAEFRAIVAALDEPDEPEEDVAEAG